MESQDMEPNKNNCAVSGDQRSTVQNKDGLNIDNFNRQCDSEAIEKRDQVVIAICVAIIIVGLVFHFIIFKIPDVQIHAALLMIIAVGYVIGFLRGKRAMFWGLVFLGINSFFWIASAVRLYRVLHP